MLYNFRRRFIMTDEQLAVVRTFPFIAEAEAVMAFLEAGGLTVTLAGSKEPSLDPLLGTPEKRWSKKSLKRSRLSLPACLAERPSLKIPTVVLPAAGLMAARESRLSLRFGRARIQSISFPVSLSAGRWMV
jgi:hypothetical protein